MVPQGAQNAPTTLGLASLANRIACLTNARDIAELSDSVNRVSHALGVMPGRTSQAAQVQATKKRPTAINLRLMPSCSKVENTFPNLHSLLECARVIAVWMSIVHRVSYALSGTPLRRFLGALAGIRDGRKKAAVMIPPCKLVVGSEFKGA